MPPILPACTSPSSLPPSPPSSSPQTGVSKFGSFEVEVIDPVADYLAVLQRVFDFPLLKKFLARKVRGA